MKNTLLISLLVIALPLHAEPQSDTPSQASAISLAPSVEVAAITLSAIPAGSHLIVKAIRPVGELIEVVAISAATGVSITLTVSAAALRLTGTVIGGTLVVATVSAGFILMAGSEMLAFIPNEACQSHIHHRKLSL
ncbi:MAG: hypothetical protein ABI644_03280 [Arenimonas sp.]